MRRTLELKPEGNRWLVKFPDGVHMQFLTRTEAEACCRQMARHDPNVVVEILTADGRKEGFRSEERELSGSKTPRRR